MITKENPSDEVGTGFASDALPASAPARKARKGGDALKAWGTVALVVAWVGLGSWLAWSVERAGSLSFWLYAIGPTLVVAAFALFRAYRDGEILDWVRPEWGDMTRGIVSAAVLLGASVAFLHTFVPQGSPREGWMARIYLQLGDPQWLRAHNGMMAGVLLVAAFGEEVTWRGFVARLIAERVGSRFAWMWAAFPYALSLLPTAWALRDPEAGLNPCLLLAALFFGLVWGGMARWTRRLAPSVLSHAGFDWCVLMIFRLWGSGL
jgi:membrane protease YdiL (CAAX protease family)